jgi:predicted HNH restriction endonuclease
MIVLTWNDGTEEDYFDEKTIYDETTFGKMQSHYFRYLSETGSAKYVVGKIENGISINYKVPNQYRGINRGRLEFTIDESDIKKVIWKEKGAEDYSNFSIDFIEAETPVALDSEDGRELYEGAKRYINHFKRERNGEAVVRKKMSAGKYPVCEICQAASNSIYNDSVSEGFIECHHILPISKREGIYKILQEELLLVCANCHRIIHRHMAKNQKELNWDLPLLKKILKEQN